jgi:hypothetical protein
MHPLADEEEGDGGEGERRGVREQGPLPRRRLRRGCRPLPARGDGVSAAGKPCSELASSRSSFGMISGKMAEDAGMKKATLAP